tara:strand:+ start:78 stop:584 length:507 start_codon:yes stop_codon:yes gene_type:complete
MKFYTRYGGVETHTPWKRPTSEALYTWRDSLSFPLTDWYIVGNFIEEFSPTWDIDIILIQNPLRTHLNDLSDMFTEMLTKGFANELLVDPCWMPEFYQDEWKPIRKIRPDKEFYKEWNGGIYNPVYKADEVEQLAPYLWEYKYLKPHDNYFKGKNRGYSFKGVRLNKF